jgi:hypothetical protein
LIKTPGAGKTKYIGKTNSPMKKGLAGVVLSHEKRRNIMSCTSQNNNITICWKGNEKGTRENGEKKNNRKYDLYSQNSTGGEGVVQ